MDIRKLEKAADEWSLRGELPLLAKSQLSERRELLMASAPHVWGLRVWISGVDIALLDSKGFVCSTVIERLAFRLCQFESTFGEGSLRGLLSRPIIDPYAAVFRVQAPRRIPMPENKVTEIRKNVLATDIFKKYLEEL